MNRNRITRDVRPVWLLDVDGVVNAVTKKPDRNVWPKHDWISTMARTSGGSEWPIWSARPVISFISRIHAEGLADIRWHSTWQHDTACLSDLLGLPLLPVHNAPEYLDFRRSDRWWKIPGALRVVEQESRSLVWTDDDAGNSWDLPSNDRTRLRASQPVLIVAPSPYTGLTPRHLRRIEGFLRDQPPARAAERNPRR